MQLFPAVGVRDAGLIARLFVTTPLSILILVQGLHSLLGILRILFAILDLFDWYLLELIGNLFTRRPTPFVLSYFCGVGKVLQ